MKTDQERAVPDELRPGGAAGGCPVEWVAVGRLRTSFAALRQGRVERGRAELAELPLRAVSVRGQAGYEVVDGFKRLERWVGQGAEVVPVVVERAVEPREAKRLLLAANAPPRTLSIMDEARVVASLRGDDQLGPKTIARTLGKKPAWVLRRLALVDALSPAVERKLDAGRLTPELAYALTGLGPADQERVVAAAERHSLGPRKAAVLVSALRAVGSAEERERLLTAPHALFAQPALGQSAVAARIEERLRRAQGVLAELAELELPPDLSEAEQRRLGALLRSVDEQIHTLAGRATGVAQPEPTPPRQEDVHERPEEPEREPSWSRGRGGADAAALPRAGAERSAPPEGDQQRREPGRAGADPRAPRGGGGGDARDRPGDRPQPSDRAAGAAGGGAARPEPSPGGGEAVRQAG